MNSSSKKKELALFYLICNFNLSILYKLLLEKDFSLIFLVETDTGEITSEVWASKSGKYSEVYLEVVLSILLRVGTIVEMKEDFHDFFCQIITYQVERYKVDKYTSHAIINS